MVSRRLARELLVREELDRIYPHRRDKPLTHDALLAELPLRTRRRHRWADRPLSLVTLDLFAEHVVLTAVQRLQSDDVPDEVGSPPLGLSDDVGTTYVGWGGWQGTRRRVVMLTFTPAVPSTATLLRVTLDGAVIDEVELNHLG